MMVLGQFIYTAQSGSATSDEALKNPYQQDITLGTAFLQTSPFLKGVIGDTHFYQRDRMGRS